MGADSKIEWTDHTFNPWIGCTAVSPACDHCYAKALVEGRMAGNFAERRRTAPSTWRQPMAWNRKAEREGKRARVFCASLADVFDNQVPAQWRFDLWLLIAITPHLDWLLLTKRPQNIAKMLPTGTFHAEGRDLVWPWPNVWLGTTVENRTEMLRRAPLLKAVPARMHFWSAEPLLGNLGEIPPEVMPSWVIAGGESGPGARPMHPDWARSLRDQCAAAGVPFLFKQWGEWEASLDRERDDPDWRKDYSNDFVNCGRSRWLNLAGGCGFHGDRFHVMRRVGKKAAGRLLDGVQHDGFPA